MTEVTIVYWRDIPAQVIVGRGRNRAKRELPDQFEQAIGRAAMKCQARDTESYLAEWRRDTVPAGEGAGTPDEIAAAEAARLEAEYDRTRLKALIANEGWA